MAKVKFNYFNMFIRATEYSQQAAKLLEDIIMDYNPGELEEKMKEMHAIEQAADHAKHSMHDELIRAFITPIDREDIMLISQMIDDVIDAIEDVLMRLYMYNITEIRKDVCEFAQVILKCCEALNIAMHEFPHFRKSVKLNENIVEINRLEEDCDRLYTKSVRNLYLSEANPVKVMAWSEIYDQLEKCCDSCEHVANQMESVVMKNS